MAVPILMVVFILAFIGTIIEYPVASLSAAEENLTLVVVRSSSRPSKRYPGATLGGRHPVRPADHGGGSDGATLDRLRRLAGGELTCACLFASLPHAWRVGRNHPACGALRHRCLASASCFCAARSMAERAR